MFLAGDAAHQLSPSGALGTNSGIEDAVDLAGNSGAVLSDAGARVFCSLTTSSAGRSAHGTPE